MKETKGMRRMLGLIAGIVIAATLKTGVESD